jgi:hypothetical protein
MLGILPYKKGNIQEKIIYNAFGYAPKTKYVLAKARKMSILSLELLL